MTEKKRISVAMALYQSDEFLEEQLRSICEQTLPPDEIVLCDDAPGAHTADIIERTRARWNTIDIRYRVNPRRLGVDRNFASAIAECTGEIIFLSDQDDVWLPEKIRLLADAVGEGGAFCNSTAADGSLKPLGYSHWEMREFAPIPDAELLFEFFLRRVPAAGHNMAFNAKWKELLLPLPGLFHCHDSWIGSMIAAVAGWQVIDRELTLYRVHDKNLSRPRRPGLIQQWEAAREAIRTNASGWTAELLYELLLRCDVMDQTVDPRRRALILSRIRHARAREDLSDKMLPRLPIIAREYLSGNYGRWGRGWRNALQDLFLR
ncbi:MAG: glycosyltransferase [Lentisphaeria bacterium]|nr:glycosyltransferase [Lentisphaeria bacterium]